MPTVISTEVEENDIRGRQNRLRRLIARSMIFNASDSGVTSIMPTVTAIGDTVTAGLTQSYGVTTIPSLFTLYGGVPYVVGSVSWRAPSITVTSNGNVSAIRMATGARAAFRTDAASFDIAVISTLASSRYRVLIDGQYVDRVGYAPAINPGTYGTTRFNIALPSGTTRKLRRIDVEFEKDMGFRGVQVAPGDTVQAVATGDRYRIALIGDSISAGVGATRVNDGFAFHAARRLGNMDVDMVSMSLGGTGYINTGSAGMARFRDRLDDLLAYGSGTGSVDEIWFAGGANDQSSNASEITASALACFVGGRQRCPTAPVIVFGSFIGGSNSASALAVETAVKLAFDQWGDRNSAFVPFSLGNPRLQTGTSENPTSGNFQYYLAGGDGTHPTDIGHDYIGAYVAEARRGIQF